MPDEGYTGERSEYRGNGVTKYVLERIDALDDKIDTKLDAIAASSGAASAKLDHVDRRLTEHTDSHRADVEARARRKAKAIAAAKWVSAAALTLLTAILGSRGL